MPPALGSLDGRRLTTRRSRRRRICLSGSTTTCLGRTSPASLLFSRYRNRCRLDSSRSIAVPVGSSVDLAGIYRQCRDRPSQGGWHRRRLSRRCADRLSLLARVRLGAGSGRRLAHGDNGRVGKRHYLWRWDMRTGNRSYRAIAGSHGRVGNFDQVGDIDGLNRNSWLQKDVGIGGPDCS